MWCGANRFEYLEVTLHDEAIRKIFDYRRMAGHKSVQRYFRKFGQATNQRVFQAVYQRFFQQLHFDNFTLDLDSTVMSRYGQQQGARRGYNPQKPGRNSHHPLLAFVADCRMVANCWLRSGDAHTANNFEGFLQDTLEHLAGKKVGCCVQIADFARRPYWSILRNRNIQSPILLPDDYMRLYSACLPRIGSGLRLKTA